MFEIFGSSIEAVGSDSRIAIQVVEVESYKLSRDIASQRDRFCFKNEAFY